MSTSAIPTWNRGRGSEARWRRGRAGASARRAWGTCRTRPCWRWRSGSATRLLDVPLLVATASAARIRRVLIATDLTGMVSHTIAAGERLARLCGAEVRVVHVIPSHPLSGDPRADAAVGERLRQVEEALERGVSPLVAHPGATRAVLHGPIRGALAEEAAEWEADVLVVGSHSLPPLDRLLLGSVSDALLRQLPTSILVVPYPR